MFLNLYHAITIASATALGRATSSQVRKNVKGDHGGKNCMFRDDPDSDICTYIYFGSQDEWRATLILL